MDTKERNAARRPRKAPAGKTNQRRRATATTRQHREEPNAAAARQRRQRKAAVQQRRRPAQVKRVVKAPREDIPGVVYTMPKPLHRGKFLMRLVTVAAVVVAMMMAISIFFRVDTVRVLGAQKYTPWDVSQASGIQEGDGLLTLSKSKVAGKIHMALPYVDEVKISVTLPGTVNIEIKELQVTYALAAQDNSWWLIAADGDVVQQIETSAASGYTRIFGVQADAPRTDAKVTAAADQIPEQTEPEPTEEGEISESQPGADLTLPTQVLETNAQRLDAALSILQSLERNGVIGQIASVNVQSLSEIQLQYGQRFQVRLGTTDNLDYKIRYMNQAISQMEDYQTGQLDVSFEYGEEGIFTPEA